MPAETVFRKLLSYIFPVTRRITTEMNGVLEITWFNGKKMLNSAHANYSYDSLQRILKSGLTHIDFKNLHSILLLGLGGGSVIQTLRTDFNFKENITAIELDATVIGIAEKEFDIKNEKYLKIIHSDAFEFVKNTEEQFDLIIIDLFIDATVPGKAYEHLFWKHIYRLLKSKGCFLFNASMKQSEDSILAGIKKLLDTDFNIQQFDVEGLNILMIGKKLA